MRPSANAPLTLINYLSIYTLGILLLSAMALSVANHWRFGLRSFSVDETLMPERVMQNKPFTELQIRAIGRMQGESPIDGSLVLDVRRLDGRWSTLTFDLPSERSRIIDATGKIHESNAYDPLALAKWFEANDIDITSADGESVFHDVQDQLRSITTRARYVDLPRATQLYLNGGSGSSEIHPPWPWQVLAVAGSIVWLLMVFVCVRDRREPGWSPLPRDSMASVGETPDVAALTSNDSVCGQCGYSTRGLTELICPECGGDFRDVGIVHRVSRSHLRGGELRTIVLMVIALSVLSYIASMALAHSIPIRKVYDNRIRLSSITSTHRYELEGHGSTYSESAEPFPVTLQLRVAPGASVHRLIYDPEASTLTDPESARSPPISASTPSLLSWIRKNGGALPDGSEATEAEEVMGFLLSYSRPYAVPYNEGAQMMSGSASNRGVSFASSQFSQRASGEISAWFSYAWIVPSLLASFFGARYVLRRGRRAPADVGFTSRTQGG